MDDIGFPGLFRVNDRHSTMCLLPTTGFEKFLGSWSEETCLLAGRSQLPGLVSEHNFRRKIRQVVQRKKSPTRKRNTVRDKGSHGDETCQDTYILSVLCPFCGLRKRIFSHRTSPANDAPDSNNNRNEKNGPFRKRYCPASSEIRIAVFHPLPRVPRVSYSTPPSSRRR